MKVNGKHEVLAHFAGRGLLLAALLAMVLSVAAISSAQSGAATVPAQGARRTAPLATATQAPPVVAAPTAPSASAPAPAEEKPSAKGAQEGIKVHGHWTIEVKNPDGTVVTHREFENGLAGTNGINGANLLAGLLSGNFVVGAWSIVLAGNPGPCSTYPSPSVGSCIILASNATAQGTKDACSTSLLMVTPASAQPWCYATLQESLTGTGPLFTSLTLSGAVYADQAVTIGTVFTGNTACPASATLQLGTAVTPAAIPPATCLTTAVNGVGNETGGNVFTSTNLASPGIPVAAGQIVQATVVISFQ